MSQEAIKPNVPAATPAAPEPTPVTPEAGDPRLEQLTKRERAIRAQQRQLQQEREAFKAEQAKLKAAPPDDSWKGKLKSDFINMAAEAGLSHEEIAQQLMNRTPESLEMRKIMAKFAELEAKQNQVVDKVTEQNNKAYQQAIKQVERDVKITIHNNEAYELINSKGKTGLDSVVEYIKSTYEEDGILLSAEEAAQEVEDYLLEEATSLAKLKKVQAKLTPPEVKEDPAKKTPNQKTQTLTNQATASTPTRATSAQRRERAILAMQGLLKS